MPLTAEQQNDILAFLNRKADEADTQLSAENFTNFLFSNWDDIIIPATMNDERLRQELRGLEEQRDSEDAERPNLDSEILRLRRRLGI